MSENENSQININEPLKPFLEYIREQVIAINDAENAPQLTPQEEAMLSYQKFMKNLKNINFIDYSDVADMKKICIYISQIIENLPEEEKKLLEEKEEIIRAKLEQFTEEHDLNLKNYNKNNDELLTIPNGKHILFSLMRNKLLQRNYEDYDEFTLSQKFFDNLKIDNNELQNILQLLDEKKFIRISQNNTFRILDKTWILHKRIYHWKGFSKKDLMSSCIKL
jgi:hypothetical protein